MKQKILKKLVALLLAAALIVSSDSIAIAFSSFPEKSDTYCLSPYLQINNQALQNSFVSSGVNVPITTMSNEAAHEEFSWRIRTELIEKLRGELKDQIFDVFVCGGGIAGTSVARDAASRGLSTMVVDRLDWAYGASSSSTCVIHRGVLYLERAWEATKKALKVSLGLFKGNRSRHDTIKEILSNLRVAWNNVLLARKLLKESQIIAQQSPQITKPKLVHMVIDKEDRRFPIAVYLGLMLHWVMSDFSLKRPQLYWRKSTIEKDFPELEAETIKGIVTFHEYVTDDALLTIYTAKDAYRQGAVALNFMSVEEVQYDAEKGYYLIKVLNSAGKKSPFFAPKKPEIVTIKAKCFVNAAGWGIDSIHKMVEDEAAQQISRAHRSSHGSFLTPVTGGHLVVPAREIGSERTYMMSIPRGDGSERKSIFLIHRNESGEEGKGYYLMDTSDWLDTDYSSVEKLYKERDITIEAVNRAFSKARVSSIGTSFGSGTKPLPFTDSSNINSISRDHKIVNILDRYFVLMGVKLAAGRTAAEDMVNILCESLGLKNIDRKCKTDALSLRIPDNVYSMTLTEKLTEQMIVRNAGVGKRFGPGQLDVEPKAVQKEIYGLSHDLTEQMETSVFGSLTGDPLWQKKEHKLLVKTEKLLRRDFDAENKAIRSAILNQIPTVSEFGIKTVIFDYGNAFRSFDLSKISREINTRYGIDKEIIDKYFKNQESEQNHWLFKHKNDFTSKTEDVEEFQQWIRENSKHKDLILTEDIFDSLLESLRVKPIREMEEIIEALIEKGYNVNIVYATNSLNYPSTVSLMFLPPNGKDDIYDFPIGDFNKRQNGIYRRIIEKEGGEPEQFLFISDVNENLLTAEQAGTQVAFFDPEKVEESIALASDVLEQNADAFLNGFKNPAVREYLNGLVAYMYGAYGVSQKDVIKMLDIIAEAKGSKEAIEHVYAAGFKWNDPKNKYGKIYKKYKTSIQPDIRSDLVRQFVKGNVIFDIATGNMSMLHKIIGALHNMTDKVISSILEEAHYIVKTDGQVVVLEDTASDAKAMSFPGAYKEEIRQKLSKEFHNLNRKEQNYVFAIVDWMGNHLAQNVTDIPLSFNFKTREEWHAIFSAAGFEVKEEVYPGITPYKFHTHPELISKLKPIRTIESKSLPDVPLRKGEELDIRTKELILQAI